MIYDTGTYGFCLIRTPNGLFISAARMGQAVNADQVTLRDIMMTDIALTKEELKTIGAKFDEVVPTAWIRFERAGADIGQTTRDIFDFILKTAEGLVSTWGADRVVGIEWVEPKPVKKFEAGLPGEPEE